VTNKLLWLIITYQAISSGVRPPRSLWFIICRASPYGNFPYYY